MAAGLGLRVDEAALSGLGPGRQGQGGTRAHRRGSVRGLGPGECGAGRGEDRGSGCATSGAQGWDRELRDRSGAAREVGGLATGEILARM